MKRGKQFREPLLRKAKRLLRRPVGASVTEIAEACGVTRRTVHHWLYEFEERGTALIVVGRRGPPRYKAL